jgi:glycosyltransferase involved in cell wall biosynthesis
MKSVSVILATLNSGAILKKSLQSVRSQNYDQSKIEIIVADGGSTDETIEILKKYQALIIPENTDSHEVAFFSWFKSGDR